MIRFLRLALPCWRTQLTAGRRRWPADARPEPRRLRPASPSMAMRASASSQTFDLTPLRLFWLALALAGRCWRCGGRNWLGRRAPDRGAGAGRWSSGA